MLDSKVQILLIWDMHQNIFFHHQPNTPTKRRICECLLISMEANQKHCWWSTGGDSPLTSKGWIGNSCAHLVGGNVISKLVAVAMSMCGGSNVICKLADSSKLETCISTQQPLCLIYGILWCLLHQCWRQKQKEKGKKFCKTILHLNECFVNSQFHTV